MKVLQKFIIRYYIFGLPVPESRYLQSMSVQSSLLCADHSPCCFFINSAYAMLQFRLEVLKPVKRLPREFILIYSSSVRPMSLIGEENRM